MQPGRGSRPTRGSGPAKPGGTPSRRKAALSKIVRRLGMTLLLALFGFVQGEVRALAQASSELPGVDPALIEDLVVGSRILADLGVLDAFGHVSARDPRNPKHFLMSRSPAPALVTADDIMELNEDCNAVDARGRAVFLERFIHC